MKRTLALLLVLVFALSLFACSSQPEAQQEDIFKNVVFNDATVHYNGERQQLTIDGELPAGTRVAYEGNAATEEGTYQAKVTLTNGTHTKVLNATLTIKEPTAEQVVEARANTVADNKQWFDYRYTLQGTLSVLGFEGTAEGIYTGQYRGDKTTGDFVFKRTTEGKLLIDSVKYVYGKGNQLITLKMNDDNTIKKVSNETVDEQDGFFVHKPIEQLVNSIDKDEIAIITRSSDVPGYKYKATLKFDSDNVYINKILSAVSALGTTVSLKGVEIPNLANGVQLYFNYGAGGRIDDFYISISLAVPIASSTIGITLAYEQNGATTNLQVPQDDSFILENSDIAATVASINANLLSLKESDTYSLDVSAVNDLDPSWNKLAVVDKYNARLYKNTDGSNVYFNHSYEYKAHHEEDGAETYKYTLGNVTGDDAGVYLVSRKGKNVVSAANGTYSADTQFDFLTAMALINSASVDCIKVIEKGDNVTYKVYLNKQSVLDIQKKIADIINSNDAEGVVDVNNYLNNEDYIFEEAVVEVVYKSGVLSSIKCETEIRYNPVGGEYTEYNVALKNTIEIEINNKLSAAEDYKAPSSTGTLVGIGAAKYFIL